MANSTSKSDIPALTKGCNRRGAQMGRHRSGHPHGKVFLEPITDLCPAACGAYDYEGAYWGIGKMVWRGCGYDENGDEFQFTFRSEGEDDPNQVIEDAKVAADEITGMVETCTFEVITQQSECVQNGGCEHCLGTEEDE